MSKLKNGVSAKIAAVAICAAVGASTVYFVGTNANTGSTEDTKTTTAEQTSATQQTVVSSIPNQSAGSSQSAWKVNLGQSGASTWKVDLGQAPAKQTWDIRLDGGAVQPWSVDLIDVPAAATTASGSGEESVGDQVAQAAATTTTTKAAQQTAKTTTAAKKSATTKKTTNNSVPATKVTKSGYDVNGGTAKARLNSVKAEDLKPTITPKGSEKAVLEKYMKMIVSDDMTNYGKVLTCYDYLIKHTRYDYGGWFNPMRSVLVNGFGTCTEYSHVMCAMLRYIGFKANTVWGQTAMARGGYGEHMWVEVYINGNTYVLDPQVDDNISGTIGSISHRRFVKLYSEVKGQYIRGHVEKW